MREVIVTIDKDNKMSIEVKGVKGKKCLDLTKDLELSLGGYVESREETAEMKQSASTQAQQRAGHA
jgi:hypothetical protein